MCQFFSLVSDGRGKCYYFDAAIRKEIIAGKSKYSDTDSHTSIADHFGFKGEKEDNLNKYEYNPLTEEFAIDQLNVQDDIRMVHEFCKKLDFKTIIPELVIKPIVHPFRDVRPRKVSKKHIRLLEDWASMWANVWDSVRVSVRDSVWASVRDSVWASVGVSVGDSVGAYVSSFFILSEWKHISHEKGKNPFQPCIDLWEAGFVPSFDSEIWRLHGGPDGRVIYEMPKGT